jgi:hypothetical protein
MNGPSAKSAAAALAVTACLAAGCGSDDENGDSTVPGRPAAGLPEGSYSASVSEVRLAGIPAAERPPAGKWEMNVDGRSVRLAAPDGSRTNETTADVSSDQLTLTANRTEESFACGDDPQRGIYRWASSDGSLRFTVVDDPCKDRIAVLTAGPWTE